MLYGKIKNINKKISKIILGNDVKKEYPNAIKLWDHFFNKGGNTFDNSMYYNEGKYEVFLGKWIKSRKIENYQCLWFLIQISQNSEQHRSHEINCPREYPVKQLSQAVSFTDIFEKF